MTYFIAVCFKDIWCQLPEDDEIISPKHVGNVKGYAHKLQNSVYVGVT